MFLQEYLDSVPDALQHGLSVVGQIGKFFAAFRSEYLTRVVSKDMIDKLFTAKSLDEQNYALAANMHKLLVLKNCGVVTLV